VVETQQQKQRKGIGSRARARTASQDTGTDGYMAPASGAHFPAQDELEQEAMWGS
jgi:hypothetical protein